MAMRLVSAYQASRAMNVALELNIADLLARGPMTSRQVAEETGTQVDKMHRLLRALAAFDAVKDSVPRNSN
jgi:DNA-binding IclR family transcriptional regulator